MTPSCIARAAFRHGPSLAPALAPVLARTASSGPGSTTRRGYISDRVLEVLRPTPAGRAGLQALRFQPYAHCFPNTTAMTGRAMEVLLAGGDGHRNRLVAWLASQMLPNQGLAQMNPPVTAAALATLNARHGPLQLVTYHGLQPGQGGDAYRDFHAVVKLASFDHGGRQVALLLDGNDRQSNPAMHALRTWMRADGDARDPGQLDNPQLQAVDARMRADRPGGPSLFQAAFRLVDLEQMLAASHATSPPFANGDPGMKMRAPMLPPAAVDALRQALDEDPGQVETFATPGLSRRPAPPAGAPR